MISSSASPHKTTSPHLPQAHLLILEARYYDRINDALLLGARRAIEAAGASHESVSVPGALELPLAMAILWDVRKYAGVVVLGCVIRGETGHYDIVAHQSTQALMEYALTHRIPLGNGILTVETQEQAWARARPDIGDKGGAAAHAALSLIALKSTAMTQG